MRPHDDPGHLDFLALSGHKMYAPFGTGALIGRRDGFRPRPHQPGGGTVRAVTVDDVRVGRPPRSGGGRKPQRRRRRGPGRGGRAGWRASGSTGSPPTSRRSPRYAMARLARVPGLTVHGPTGDDAARPKVGVVPFTLDGSASGYVAAVLGHEHGIGVRGGCFCAQPYVAHLLSLATGGRCSARRRRGGVDGIVRISLGGYSDTGDVDRVVDAVQQVTAGAVRFSYLREPDGSWCPAP